MSKLKQLGLVNVLDIAPRLILDIRYATSYNFYNQSVYSSPVAYLREPVALALGRVQNFLEQQGFGLKIFDAYRPFSVQELFFKFAPNPVFIKQPIRVNGKPVDGSNHNRGAAVDLTLVDQKGIELELPTPFDEFSERAWSNFQGGSNTSRKNRDYLRYVMMAEGFLPLESEWWHFDGPDSQNYGLLDIPI